MEDFIAGVVSGVNGGFILLGVAIGIVVLSIFLIGLYVFLDIEFFTILKECFKEDLRKSKFKRESSEEV